MQPHVKAAAAAGVALLMAAALRVAGAAQSQGDSQSQGAMLLPGSRTYLCYVDGHLTSGEISPVNPACAAALEVSGAQAFYDWFGVMIPDGQGRTGDLIPDGALCGAGLTQFAGFDLARDDWPVTHLSSGAQAGLRQGNRVAHAGWFSLYVTKDGYRPGNALAWGDFEPAPFYSAADPPGATLPAHKSGRHVIYSVWTRADSQETFYSCSDVVFDGGHGEVTGLGSTVLRERLS